MIGPKTPPPPPPRRPQSVRGGGGGKRNAVEVRGARERGSWQLAPEKEPTLGSVATGAYPSRGTTEADLLLEGERTITIV